MPRGFMRKGPLNSNKLHELPEVVVLFTSVNWMYFFEIIHGYDEEVNEEFLMSLRPLLNTCYSHFQGSNPRAYTRIYQQNHKSSTWAPLKHKTKAERRKPRTEKEKTKIEKKKTKPEKKKTKAENAETEQDEKETKTELEEAKLTEAEKTKEEEKGEE